MRKNIVNLSSCIGEKVLIKGQVVGIRDHGKIIFLNVYDQTGEIQCVYKSSLELREQSSVICEGTIVKREERNIKPYVNGDVELQVETIKVLNLSQELPFDLSSEFNIDTLFDYRPLTLRRDRDRNLFKAQAILIEGLRDSFKNHKFTEFQAPKLVGGDAEGGSEVFEVTYFDKSAFLATSPQLYKQILVGVFERVFCIGNVFRAEKHATSRHLNEYTSIDFEMGYIDSHKDVMDFVEILMRESIGYLEKNAEKELTSLEVEKVLFSKDAFPILKLNEVHDILGADREPDLSPEQEKELSNYIKDKYGSDFVFVTHYPVSKRPMYAYEDEEDKGYTKTFDLIFRGIEICSGGQREHRYDVLIDKIKGKSLDPEIYSFYLQAFKYGVPPHGGIGMGLERLTAKILGINNVKEAMIFPRDRNRIDKRLTE